MSWEVDRIVLPAEARDRNRRLGLRLVALMLLLVLGSIIIVLARN